MTDRMRPGHRVWALLCLAVIVAGTMRHVRAEDWPEWRGRGRLGVWNETGILDKFPAGGLRATWRTPINSGYSGPAVSEGRVFVTDSRRTKGQQAVESVTAIDEQTGQILWKKEWDANYAGLQLLYAIGPRATPTVDGDRVYVLGAMGHLFALDVKTGRVLWQKNFVEDFGTSVPSWGMTGAPLVDGDRLICLVGGEPNAKVMALNKLTGAEIWRALSSDWEPGYGQPTIIEAAGTRQLIIFQPKGINSLDPVTGKVYWEVPHLVAMGMTIPTPVHSGPYLLVTSQYGGAQMLKLDDTKPGATLLWKTTGQNDSGYPSPNSMDSVISTPVIDGEYLYGLEGHGLLRALEVATGKLVWETKDVLKVRADHGTAFFVRNGDRYFINNERGELVIARLTPQGFDEIDRTQLIEPTHPSAGRRYIPAVLWSHAAYANKHIIIRNDSEIVRFSLAKEP